MELVEPISKFFLVLFLINIFRSSNAYFNFERMVNKSTIRLFASAKTYYPGIILELSENVAIYKSKNADETIIKVLYPCEGDRKKLLENEIFILKRLNRIFHDHPVDNGIAELIGSGHALWISDEDGKRLPGNCLAIIYTYGEQLFPVLRECVQNNDRKKLFWYFTHMAKAMSSIAFEGKTFHNNIGPDVFRLTTDQRVFVDNFEVAQFIRNNKQIFVDKNGMPIGFKPTMSDLAMNAQIRASHSQFYSFMMTSYYILYDRLPWEMHAIDFLWNVNMREACEITLELRKINLKDYIESRGTWNPIHSGILSVIKVHKIDFATLSKEFRRLYNELE